MNIENLTPEQLSELEAQIEARRKAATQKIKDDREAYKELVNETVNALWTDLGDLSGTMVQMKNRVFDSFAKALELKKEAYGTKDEQQSHTFTTADGMRSITIGHRVVDRYDETVTSGINKVKRYVQGLAKDAESSALVETILNLLKPNKDGILKASRVLELEKIATKVNDEGFTDGLRIIKEAYRPMKTCQFVTVKYKNRLGQDCALPLSMSAIDG